MVQKLKFVPTYPSLPYTVWQKEPVHFLIWKIRLSCKLKMGVGLYSNKTAVKIADHIATKIRKELFTKIIKKV